MFLIPITINQHSIGSLLQAATLHIPDLQRPYAWSREQATDLIGDVNEMLAVSKEGKPAPSHFFGMVVTISGAGSSSQLIDGQQRLTTVTVLLAAIRQEFLRVSDQIEQRLPKIPAHMKEQATNVQQQCRNTADQIKALILKNEGLVGKDFIFEPRLSVSPEIKETYRAILDGTEDTLDREKLREPAQNLLEVLELFRTKLIDTKELARQDHLEQFRRLDSLKEIVQTGLIVAHLNSESGESAYDLFESLNARGVPLNELDLVKTWMLSQYAEVNDPVNMAASAEIAAVMHDLTAGDIEMQRDFFGDFCILRTLLTGVNVDLNKNFGNGVPPIQFSKNARQHVFKDPTLLKVGGVQDVRRKIAEEVEIMRTLSPIWEDLKSADDRTPALFSNSGSAQQIRASLGYLVDSNGLNFQQYGPHLMMWAKSLEDNPTLFAELVSDFERFFFRYKSICGNTPTKVRDVLSKITKQAGTAAGLSSTFISETLNTFVELDARDADFGEKLRQKLVYGGAGTKLVRYFLYRIALTSWKPPFNNQMGFVLLHADVGPNGERWTIEHIAPQNPNGTPALPEEQLHTIGNLCLLNPSINNLLSNKSFAEKKLTAKEVQAKNLITVADSAEIFYGELENWGPKEAQQREDDLVAAALKVFAF